MYEVSLSLEQYKLFRQYIFAEFNEQKIGDKIVLKFDILDSIEETGELVNDAFLEFGLDENYEPNELGYRLEELHIVFLRVVWKFRVD